MSAKKKNTFKKAVFQIHKWLGIASGLVVFIVAFTGSIFCFHDEIKDVVYSWRHVEPQDKAYVLPSELHRRAAELYPGCEEQMVFYAGKNRPAMVVQSDYAADKYYFTYFNPYTGEFLARQDQTTEFFTVVEEIHMNLLLPDPWGKQIVGVSTVIFLILLITGIIQWWPKKGKQLKDRLKIKWSAKWRRVNYDWHNVTGFYIAGVAFVIAFTGLAFMYEWAHDGMYYAANLGKEYPDERETPVIDTTLVATAGIPPLDKALTTIVKANPKDEMYYVWKPDNKSAISAGAYPVPLNYDHQSNMSFHPVTGSLLKQQPYQDKSAGMKFQEMSYGLHTGQYFGLTGKIFAFIASLLAAALPVTGFVMWWGRNNKKKPSQKKQKLIRRLKIKRLQL